MKRRSSSSGTGRGEAAASTPTWAVRTIRQGRWKLNVSANGDCELYDLQDDPEELRNAVADQGRAQTVVRLFDRLREWQRETDDPVVLPHPLGH